MKNSYKYGEGAARKFAKLHGYVGRPGGWIYRQTGWDEWGEPITGRRIVQGWQSFARKLTREGRIVRNADGTWSVAERVTTESAIAAELRTTKPVRGARPPRPDIFGRWWGEMADDELCSTCGQPDNCGDCNHAPMSDEDHRKLSDA